MPHAARSGQAGEGGRCGRRRRRCRARCRSVGGRSSSSPASLLPDCPCSPGRPGTSPGRGWDPDLAAQGDDRRAHHHRLGELVLLDVVGEPLVVTLVGRDGARRPARRSADRGRSRPARVGRSIIGWSRGRGGRLAHAGDSVTGRAPDPSSAGQFIVGSSGERRQASSPGWRRRTSRHRSAGSAPKASGASRGDDVPAARVRSRPRADRRPSRRSPAKIRRPGRAVPSTGSTGASRSTSPSRPSTAPEADRRVGVRRGAGPPPARPPVLTGPPWKSTSGSATSSLQSASTSHDRRRSKAG